MDPLMLACAIFCFGFAAFHVFFWRLLDWPNELKKMGPVNRAVMQILNLRLIYVFLAVGVICLSYPDEMRTSKVGRALLVGMSCFWAGRLAEQFIFFERRRRWTVGLGVLFLVGTILFLAPAVL